MPKLQSGKMDSTINDNGEILNIGDRVFTYDAFSNYDKVFGVLQFGETAFGEMWYVDYEDGESCIVLDINSIWKA